MNFPIKRIALCCALAWAGGAQAFTFQGESISGSFDSTITLGTGIRARDPSCSLVLDSPSGAGAPAGCLPVASGLGDQGNLNYEKGDAFTTYLKGSHELLLKLPENIKFMGRVTWLKDFSATRTSDYVSAGNPPGVGPQTHDAEGDLSYKARVTDLWLSKEFNLGEERARVRVGNQVISWGESLFIPGGINQTNAVDIMRLSQPGTQLKEAVLAAPMLSFASGLGHGVNVEAYVQSRWNENYFPPTGSYWSVVNGLGKGSDAYGLVTHKPKDGGQYGAALRYQPEGTQLNLGLYAMAYHDKAPQFSFNADGQGNLGWMYAENRRMFGISANFPVGDWSVGAELSLRPKDAVALNPNTGCNEGHCWVDEKRYQFHLTGLLSLTPSSSYGPILDFLGADTATFLGEVVAIKYPGLRRSYKGVPVAAGVWGWGFEDGGDTARPVGDSFSAGYNFDFSWVYDGSLVSGWQVVPEVYFFHAVKGRTPNSAGTFMEGAKSANFIVSFIQNPANWQFALNYATFWGGSSPFDQPYKDRDFFGAYLSRNF